MGNRGVHLLIILLATAGVIELAVYIRFIRSRSGTHGDAPRARPQEFPVASTEPVAMFMQNTVHYQFHGAAADAEWTRLAPGGGIVHLGHPRRPFMISMFHQLRCLDVLRRGIGRAGRGKFNVTASDDEQQTRHCINYIRQMVLCRADMRLEKSTGVYLKNNVLVSQDHVCQNWRALYAAVRENQAAAGP